MVRIMNEFAVDFRGNFVLVYL